MEDGRIAKDGFGTQDQPLPVKTEFINGRGRDEVPLDGMACISSSQDSMLLGTMRFKVQRGV